MKYLTQRTPRRTGEAGFTLMELLIVISIMLILMLIAIPNYLHLTRDANQTSAIQSLRAIQEAEIQYHTDYPSNGYACSLSALGPGSSASGSSSNGSAEASDLLPADLTSGIKSGYVFSIGNCTKTTVNNHDMFTSYEATAVPQSVGKTGQNGYCLNMNGQIMIDPSGGTNCTVPLR